MTCRAPHSPTPAAAHHHPARPTSPASAGAFTPIIAVENASHALADDLIVARVTNIVTGGALSKAAKSHRATAKLRRQHIRAKAALAAMEARHG